MAANLPGGLGFGKSLLYIVLALFVGLVLVKYFLNKAPSFSPGYTSNPKEIQVTYVPSDYKYDIDDENAIAILSNPHRYRREFNNLIYNFNLSLLKHVAKRMNLPDSLQRNVEKEYQKHHDYLKQLYFNDFVHIKDTTANMYETWYENDSKSAVEVMNEVASKYTCFLINHVIVTMLKAGSNNFSAKGRKIDTPCGIAMTEAVRPMMKRMEDKAAILDFATSKGILEEKVEKAIAELATMELRDKKGLSKQLQTKIWGYAVSSTDIEVSAISVLKVGFKLNEYFNVDLNSKKRTVEVTLPEPRILSHEVYPRIDKLDIGWMREVENADLNRNFNVLRGEFRREALESDLMDKAKTQADELMHLMLQPLVSSMSKSYKLKVKFRGNPDEDFDPDILDNANTAPKTKNPEHQLSESF